METIYLCIVIFLFVLAVFDLIVGVSNDAVNFLQSSVGAKADKTIQSSPSGIHKKYIVNVLFPFVDELISNSRKSETIPRLTGLDAA